MKTKKFYEKPRCQEECFIANDYISFCAPETIIDKNSVNYPNDKFYLDKDENGSYNNESIYDGEWINSCNPQSKTLTNTMYYGWKRPKPYPDESGKKDEGFKDIPYDSFIIKFSNGQWGAYDLKTVKPNRS